MNGEVLFLEVSSCSVGIFSQAFYSSIKKYEYVLYMYDVLLGYYFFDFPLKKISTKYLLYKQVSYLFIFVL